MTRTPQGAETRRLIYANLDAESDLAALKRPGAARPAASGRALRAASGFSTLLRAFAREGDELRTALPVEPDRLAEVNGLPRPRLSSGVLSGLRRRSAVLAWAETPEVAAFRLPPAEIAAPPGLYEMLWHLPRARPEAVAAVHSRFFCLDVARSLGLALPGARRVSSLEELDRHVCREPWVVKAPFSAAGRERYVHLDGGRCLEPRARRGLERLFERHGPLLFEPWMERTEDFGCVAVVTADTTRTAGFHRLLVDRHGRFRGLELRGTFRGFDGLSMAEAEALEAVLDAVSRRLREAGYAGPFGIDCWRYRGAGGSVAFHPLGEVNARMTFGLVGRCLVDRIAGPAGLSPKSVVRLKLGKVERFPAGSMPLLLPDREGTAAWLESLVSPSRIA